MDQNIIKLVSIGIFILAAGFMAVISLLAVFVFVKYGRNKSFAVLTSLVFAGLFVLGAMGAFTTLLTIF